MTFILNSGALVSGFNGEVVLRKMLDVSSGARIVGPVMYSNTLFVRSLGISAASVLAVNPQLMASTVFQLKTQFGAGGAPAATFGAPLSVSTGSVRRNIPAATFGGPQAVVQSEAPPRGTNPSDGGDLGSSRTDKRAPRQREVNLPKEYYPGKTPSAKGGIPVEKFVTIEPPAFTFAAEAGYATSHLWRGIDLVEFTSYNHTDPTGTLGEADTGVTFFGANATYKDFGFGARFIESIDDELNPFFAPLLTDLDSYQELVLSVDYTHLLIGEKILQGTVGFDFYYYPNDEFWGVENQGMFYTRFSSAQYKWAQPFVELFYNVAIDSSGSGLANGNFRGASGSDLVEGGGVEFGVNGGDRVYTNDKIAVGLTYSLSGFYKTGYQFEDDGFTHLSLTIGAPISFGQHFTITPSLSYLQELSDIDVLAGPGTDKNPSAYNEPGFVGTIKATWTF